MLSVSRVRELLYPFSVNLSDCQVEHLLAYNALLLHWNKKINLTAIDDPEESVTRHFGESFFLSTVVKLSGRLLDVGSGAGFPGMALKLLCPSLEISLLEPIAKKRAFLKEVAKACEFGLVEVVGKTLDEFISEARRNPNDFLTIRAVGNLKRLLPQAVQSLNADGHLCLWVGMDQIPEIQGVGLQIEWKQPVQIPLSCRRQIFVGRISPQATAREDC